MSYNKDEIIARSRIMFTKLLLHRLIVACLSVDATVIITNSGPVRGKLVQDEIVNYYSYQGIPYAENPTGDLRFKPPVAKTPWTKIFDATKPGPVCPQSENQYRRELMSEDCLNLNIYVPAKRRELLPVVVFVHGGEFKSLSGDYRLIYGPQLILKRNVIFISMNYRLGALGFLSFHTEDVAGNAGVKDILLSLKWIKENIECFGGDRNKITLGGNSAGAVLLHYLMMSTKSTGLFQQAILISGSALGYRFLAKHPVDVAIKFAKELGFVTQDTNELIKQLKNADVFDLVTAQENMGKNNSRNGFRPFSPFVPCVEIENDDAIITRNPIDIIRDGIPQNVPILTGFNAQEGIKMIPAITKDNILRDNLNNNFELCIPSNIEYRYGSAESEDLATSIRQFYFDGADISNSTLHNFVDLVRETQFSYGIDAWIKLHKERRDSNELYYYVLSYDGELNWFKKLNDLDFPGTAHADELGYIFVTNATRSILKTANANTRHMLDVMITVLTNFIKFGNPTPRYDEIGTIWPECGTERNHLQLSDNPKSCHGPPLPIHLDFWHNVYEEYYEYLEYGGKIEKKIIP